MTQYSVVVCSWTEELQSLKKPQESFKSKLHTIRIWEGMSIAGIGTMEEISIPITTVTKGDHFLLMENGVGFQQSYRFELFEFT